MFLDKIFKKNKPEEEDDIDFEVEESVEKDETEPVLEEFLDAIESDKSGNIEQALGMVLAKARRITGAEAGSIFITRPVAESAMDLLACASQNDFIKVEHESFVLPINGRSIVGYVAKEGDIVHIDDLYNISIDAPYTFNRSFDDKNDYRSVSMLAFPLKNFNKEVIGVVQLINHIAGIDDDGNTKYTPFPISTVEQMKSIMTILGVMVERVDLISEIKRLRGEGCK